MEQQMNSHQPLILAHERARLEAANLLRSRLEAELVVSQCILKDCQEFLLQGRSQEALERLQSVSDVLSPNPPKDTDGRGEGSGRGWVRELQGRWPGVLG